MAKANNRHRTVNDSSRIATMMRPGQPAPATMMPCFR